MADASAHNRSDGECRNSLDSRQQFLPGCTQDTLEQFGKELAGIQDFQHKQPAILAEMGDEIVHLFGVVNDASLACFNQQNVLGSVIAQFHTVSCAPDRR